MIYWKLKPLMVWRIKHFKRVRMLTGYKPERFECQKLCKEWKAFRFYWHTRQEFKTKGEAMAWLAEKLSEEIN